jgi:hypothetical protein
MSKSIDKIPKPSPTVKPKTDEARKGGRSTPGGPADAIGETREAASRSLSFRKTVRRVQVESGVAEHGACTMCGEFCAYQIMDDAIRTESATASHPRIGYVSHAAGLFPRNQETKQ